MYKSIAQNVQVNILHALFIKKALSEIHFIHVKITMIELKLRINKFYFFR